MNKKTLVQGFGAAILIMLLRVWPLISPRHSLIYHSFLPVHSVVWGILIDLAAISLLLALLFGFLQKSQTGPRTFIWTIVAATLAPAFVIDLAAAWQKPVPTRWLQFLQYGLLLAGLAIVLLRPVYYQRAVRGFRLLLLLVGCGMVWILPELLYLGLRAEPHDTKVPVRQTGPHVARESLPAGGGRVLWLLFDELSYNQAFDHRVPGLAMPVFDKLKSESVSFSDLKPVGYETERVVPSFFLGHAVDDIRSDINGEPKIKLAGQPDWQPFDARATVFSDAQRLGWTTGIVGWYNPYCRILAGTFNYCFWRMGNGQWNGTSSDQSALKNAMAPFMEMAGGYRRERDISQEKKHTADLSAIMPQAEALIRDQSIGFVFIHLPVPHPPGVYDRGPEHQRPTGTYIDNLALADRSLGKLMDSLSATPLAAKTTIVVCSDHSWRIPLWRGTPQWSEEEETASHGVFDKRPVLMIHFPGQTKELDVTVPFDEIKIHDILEHILRGQAYDFGKSVPAGGTILPVTARP
jgi:Sulfatase